MEGFVNVTYACNAQCPFCYLFRTGRTRESRIISKKFFERFCMLIRKYNGTSITLVGGEPLMLSDRTLLDLIEIAKSYDLQIGMETNGSLLDKHYDEVLLSFDYIFVSLDYLSKRHEEIRKIKVLDKIERYLKSFPNLSLTSVFLGDNLTDIVKMTYICVEMNKPYYVKLCKPDFNYDWRDVLALYDFILTLQLSAGVLNIRVVDEPSFYTYSQIRYRQTGFEKLKRAIPSFDCGMGTGHLVLDLNGDLYGCVYSQTEQTKVGNIVMSFEEIYRNILAVRKRRVKKKGLCRICPIKECTGCPIAEPGSWKYCPVLHCYYPHLATTQSRPQNIPY